jgi:tetrathionate reductase subunit B
MEESEAKEYIKKAEYPKPERVKQDKPRVLYLGLPRRFVAGTVYDPVEKEVIIGANVTLTDNNDKQSYSAKTDNYGDFEFEGLPVSKFTLVIAKGRKSKTIKVSTDMDITLGDIPLT